MATIDVKTVPERSVYALRNVGPYGTIGKAFDRVIAHAVARNGRIRDVFGVFCDDPGKVPEADRVSFACVEVDGKPTPSRDIEVRRLPQGLIAEATAKGAYGGPEATATYRAIYDWIHQGGEYEALDLAPRTPFETACRETYPNDPEETPKRDLLTVIQIPIRKRTNR